MATQLNICVSEHIYESVEVTNIILSSLGIITTILIIIHASIQLPKQSKMKNIFKFLFWLTASLAILTQSCDIIATISCIEDIQQVSFLSIVISLASYLSLLLVLLTTLLARLKLTFDGSVYQLSIQKQCCLLILYILSMSLSVAAICVFTYMVYKTFHNEYWVGSDQYHVINRTAIALGCMSGVFHLFTAAWSVYLFAKNLMDVAVSTFVDDGDKEHGNGLGEINLNATQKKMIDSIARYVSLFSISTVTSFCTLIVLSGGRWWPEENKRHGQTYMIISGVDSVINLICCYLQYQFNIKYYEKFCGCLGCWRPYFIRTMKANMQRTQLKGTGQLQPLKTDTECTENIAINEGDTS